MPCAGCATGAGTPLPDPRLCRGVSRSSRAAPGLRALHIHVLAPCLEHGSCWPGQGRSDAVSFASLHLRHSLSWFSHSFVLNYLLISFPPSSICSLSCLFSHLFFSSFSFCCLLLDFLPSFLSHLAVLSLIPSVFFSPCSLSPPLGIFSSGGFFLVPFPVPGA